jgi:large subunit ribosomal protein L4
MTVKKFIKYNSLDINGQVLNDDHKLELNVLEKSGNYLIHKDVLRQQISKKQGTVSTKTRSEVRGGGRKPWRQKGTGRARAGSNRSPLWRGGGVLFGPKPKQTVLKLNKKERKLALQTLLYNKRNNISVIENLENAIESAKTKTFFNICKNCGVDLNQKVLVVVAKKTPALKLSIRNMKNVELISASNLNTLSILKAKQILLTPLAVNEIKETYCG